MRKTAAFQEAYLNFQRRAEVNILAISLNGPHPRQRFPTTCHLPNTFPQTIRDMFRDRSNMRLEHGISKQCGGRSTVHTSEGWSHDDWVEEWNCLLRQYLKTPSGGIRGPVWGLSRE
jgi:hypothetical protein